MKWKEDGAAGINISDAPGPILEPGPRVGESGDLWQKYWSCIKQLLFGGELQTFRCCGSSSDWISFPLQLRSPFDSLERHTLHPLTDLEDLCKHGNSAAVIKTGFERIQGSSSSDTPTLAVHIRPNWIISVYLLILHICCQRRVESRSSSLVSRGPELTSEPSSEIGQR